MQSHQHQLQEIEHMSFSKNHTMQRSQKILQVFYHIVKIGLLILALNNQEEQSNWGIMGVIKSMGVISCLYLSCYFGEYLEGKGEIKRRFGDEGVMGYEMGEGGDRCKMMSDLCEIEDWDLNNQIGMVIGSSGFGKKQKKHNNKIKQIFLLILDLISLFQIITITILSFFSPIFYLSTHTLYILLLLQTIIRLQKLIYYLSFLFIPFYTLFVFIMTVPQRLPPPTTSIFSSSSHPAPDCKICLFQLTDGQQITTLSCHNNHKFHKQCLQNWLKIKMKCPVCKHVITTNNQDY